MKNIRRIVISILCVLGAPLPLCAADADRSSVQQTISPISRNPCCIAGITVIGAGLGYGVYALYDTYVNGNARESIRSDERNRQKWHTIKQNACYAVVGGIVVTYLIGKVMQDQEQHGEQADHNNGNNDTLCSICFATDIPPRSADRVECTRCKNGICRTCYNGWQYYDDTCPFCRAIM